MYSVALILVLVYLGEFQTNAYVNNYFGKANIVLSSVGGLSPVTQLESPPTKKIINKVSDESAKNKETDPKRPVLLSSTPSTVEPIKSTTESTITTIEPKTKQSRECRIILNKILRDRSFIKYDAYTNTTIKDCKTKCFDDADCLSFQFVGIYCKIYRGKDILELDNFFEERSNSAIGRCFKDKECITIPNKSAHNIDGTANIDTCLGNCGSLKKCQNDCKENPRGECLSFLYDANKETCAKYNIDITDSKGTVTYKENNGVTIGNCKTKQ